MRAPADKKGRERKRENRNVSVCIVGKRVSFHERKRERKRERERERERKRERHLKMNGS